MKNDIEINMVIYAHIQSLIRLIAYSLKQTHTHTWIRYVEKLSLAELKHTFRRTRAYTAHAHNALCFISNSDKRLSARTTRIATEMATTKPKAKTAPTKNKKIKIEANR